ncbi:MAG: ribosome maturation factor RimM [Balneolaceae bacterium]|nr:ribosome maturation factor RimM [Balneolaceae bacterium]
MLEPVENQYMRIGQIARPHGVEGEVMITSDFFIPDLLEEIELVRYENSRGDLIPARVESVRVEEKQNRLSFFVKFEHVMDRGQAVELKGSPVYVERERVEELIDEEEVSPDLAGYEVVDSEGNTVGKVEELLENPAHPILSVLGREQQQLLIPYVDEYIVSTDEKNRRIECRNLDQLFEE